MWFESLDLHFSNSPTIDYSADAILLGRVIGANPDWGGNSIARAPQSMANSHFSLADGDSFGHGSGLGSGPDQLPEQAYGLGRGNSHFLNDEFLMLSSDPNDPTGDNDNDGIPNGEDADWDIVVTGTRPRTYDPDPGSDPGSPPPPAGPGGEPACPCSSFTAAQKAEQAVDAEAAKVREDILQQADQNMEYGSLIWRDSAGTLHSTPLRPSSDYHARFDLSGMPTNADGTTDFSGVVAMVHSHPEYLPNPTIGQPERYFTSEYPDRLLYPSQMHTRDGITQGDWLTFDRYAQLIAADGGNATAFKQYIVGFDGEKLVIYEYTADDRETNTAASGDSVDPATAACTC